MKKYTSNSAKYTCNLDNPQHIRSYVEALRKGVKPDQRPNVSSKWAWCLEALEFDFSIYDGDPFEMERTFNNLRKCYDAFDELFDLAAIVRAEAQEAECRRIRLRCREFRSPYMTSSKRIYAVLMP